ncbi:MAG: DUF3842 family protein [Erysipelotrichaceae bacterium]|nr:DUF3842 family protein [Erysipelotrichaceae bacterium]
MKILVIDGQGGNIGRQLVKLIMDRFPDQNIIAVGTNSLATGNMLKSGVQKAATGENAVIVNSRSADVILGPVGIVIADSLLGEVTPAMAHAVGSSNAQRILIPISKCDTLIAGVTQQTLGDLLEDAVAQLGSLIDG